MFLSACLCLVEDITKEKALLTSALIFENFINYVTQDEG